MRSLDNFINLIYRGRMTILFVSFIVAIAIFLIVGKANFSENIYDVLPVNDNIVQAHVWAGKAFKKSNSFFFAVRRNSADSSAQADEFARRLKKIDDVSNVVCSVGNNIDSQKAYAYLPMFFDSSVEAILKESLSEQSLKNRFLSLRKGVLQNDYIAKTRLKSDPLGVLDSFSSLLKRSFTFKGARIEDFKIASDSGKSYLIILTGNFDCSDSNKSIILIEKIERVIESMARDYPSFSVAYAGGYRISACNAAIARNSSTVCVVVTIVLMIAICFASFRNRYLALIATIPSIIGSIVALGVVCACFERISSISIAFASIAIGVSIDYAIHILHFVDNTNGEFTLARAKACVRRYCFPIGIVSGTTILAFVLMLLFGSSGFIQLGLFGFVGIFVSAIVSVFLLPLFLVGIKLKSSKNTTFVEALALKINNINSAKALVVVFLIGSLFFVNFGGLFNEDMSFFNSLDSSAKKDEAFLRKEFSNALASKSMLLRSSNLEELLQDNEKLNTLLIKSQRFIPYGLHNMLISRKSAAENLQRWCDFWKRDFSNAINKACSESGIKTDMVLKANAEIVSQTNLISVQDLKKSPLREMFANCLYIADGQFALLSSFYEENSSGASSFDILKKIESQFGNANIISADYLGKHIASTSANWLIYFALIAFVLVGVYLLVFLRNIKAVVAILTPVAMGLCLAFILFSILSIKINIINFVFVIFAVCLAQDYAVFVYNAIKNRESVDRVFAPILVSSVTTITAFAVLAFSEHSAISSLGSVSAIAITSIVFMVFVFCECFSKWAVKK